jgi:hypothetical protein
VTRVLIFGSRDWQDAEAIYTVLNGYRADDLGVTVIQGGGRGADSIAKRWAKINAEEYLTFSSDRDRYGRAAGPLRNQRQLQEGKPEVAWGFVIKPLAESRDSADMARRLKAAGIPCYLVTRGVGP